MTKAQKEAKRARTRAWKELSASLRAQAGKCLLCGSPDRLCVHHVLHKKQYPGLMFEERNLVVLCAKCHCRLHRGRELEFFSRLQSLDPDKWNFVWSWLKVH